MTPTKKPKEHSPSTSKPKKLSSGDHDAPFSLGEYFKGVRTEWTKISWPTLPQIWGQSIIVLVVVTISSVGLWAIDNIFRLAIGFIVPAGR